jgi:hypothetical protein
LNLDCRENNARCEGDRDERRQHPPQDPLTFQRTRAAAHEESHRRQKLYYAHSNAFGLGRPNDRTHWETSAEEWTGLGHDQIGSKGFTTEGRRIKIGKHQSIRWVFQGRCIGLISLDEERGIIFLPVGNPASSFYGADRPGTNLYANCLLALDAKTGNLLWYFQTTHHDLIDADLAGAPILFEVTRNGRKIPAVAEATKLNMVFILDRLTGKPIYPVEERPVPKSSVPGEQSWPTQPFTVKPPPLGRLSVTRDELTAVTAESRQYCLDWWDREKMHNEGAYSSYGADGTTVMFPGTIGGGNWGGMAFNPQLGYLFVNTSKHPYQWRPRTPGVICQHESQAPDPRNLVGSRRPVKSWFGYSIATPRGD